MFNQFEVNWIKLVMSLVMCLVTPWWNYPCMCKQCVNNHYRGTTEWQYRQRLGSIYPLILSLTQDISRSFGDIHQRALKRCVVRGKCNLSEVMSSMLYSVHRSNERHDSPLLQVAAWPIDSLALAAVLQVPGRSWKRTIDLVRLMTGHYQ